MRKSNNPEIHYIETTPENKNGPLIIMNEEKRKYFANILSKIDPARDYLDLRTIDFNGVEFRRPRGKEKATLHGTLPEKISTHTLKLAAVMGGDKSPVGIQYISQSDKEQAHHGEMPYDSLMEREHEKVHRVVWKYENRVLFPVTTACDTFCRACTRVDIVGGALPMTPEQIKESLEWISQNPDVDEIIFSGGDPLTLPYERLALAINGAIELQNRGQIDIIRIGTRLPIHNPARMLEKPESLQKLAELLKPIKNLNIMLHIDHPLEITAETLEVINYLRQHTNVEFNSQSVLWAGVNDNVDTLVQLFKKIKRSRINPYYIFQNDEVPQARHFTVPIPKAMQLMRETHSRLSGLEVPTYVIDVAGGYGKIPVPYFWDNVSEFTDFKGNRFKISNDGMTVIPIGNSKTR